MMKEGTNNGSGSSNNWSRVCDTCRSAACIVYCHADSAYLCSGCDARIHAANRVASRHERVWVCEACERAPAAFLCKADAASLCSSCDADIHSANPLASRHHRVPILPITGCLLGEEDHGFIDTRGVSLKLMCNGREVEKKEEEVVDEEEDEAEAASWLLPNPVKNSDDNDQSNRFLFGGEVDEYLDLVDCKSCGENQFSTVVHYDDHHGQQHHQHNYGVVPLKNYVADSVVPVECGGEAGAQMQKQQSQHFQPCLDFDSSKAELSYNGSISQSVSISSMEVGVVPESTISDVSVSHSKPPTIGTGDLFPPIPMPSHLTPMDREARVLRYREKKKTRKFEKKIRYASRKAYAETRPRIKGRFARRTDIEAEVNQMLSTTLMAEARYSIVPSF